MNRCQSCNLLLPPEAFPYIRKGQPDRRNHCRSCIAEGYRRWAAINRERLLERKRAYWHRTGKFSIGIKATEMEKPE